MYAIVGPDNDKNPVIIGVSISIPICKKELELIEERFKETRRKGAWDRISQWYGIIRMPDSEEAMDYVDIEDYIARWYCEDYYHFGFSK